jgi:hypothetical protein
MVLSAVQCLEPYRHEFLVLLPVIRGDLGADRNRIRRWIVGQSFEIRLVEIVTSRARWTNQYCQCAENGETTGSDR